MSRNILQLGVFLLLAINVSFSAETVLFEKLFSRSTSAPKTETYNFGTQGIQGPFLIRVENGPAGYDKVSSANVLVNGKTVFSEKDFNQKVKFLEREISFQSDNTVQVTIKSKPGAALKISFWGTKTLLSPDVVITSPADGVYFNHSPITVAWSINGVEQTTSTTEDLKEGQNTISRSATNSAGTGTASVSVYLDTRAPVITGILPGNGSYLNTARPTISATFSDELSGIDVNSIHITLDGRAVSGTGISGENFSFTPQWDMPDGVHSVDITIKDRAGNQSTSSITFRTYSSPLPPDPATVAPELDRTVVTDLKSATSFLYSGSNFIQTGMSPDLISPVRAAVIRGKVLDRNGDPLPGVKVTVHDHPEFGQTLSRMDGVFDLAVNGGGYLILQYEKDQYFKAQRKVDVPWQEYVWAQDVIMIQPDPKVTTISLFNNTEMQVAQGSEVTDDDGTRKATILFPKGTQVVNFNAQSINVRATEYTVGENGPNAMPADLPPQIGYTYCVELSVDGAEDVRFNQPVFVYVENFLNFPVGGIVPAGYYDKERAVWVPSKNGRIINVLAVESGRAVLDVIGSGSESGEQDLVALGIDEEELQKLGQLYAAGQSLWRVPVTHFTPWDCNWGAFAPSGASSPSLQEPKIDEIIDNSSSACGSIIEVENQTLGEALKIAGSPYGLHYTSDRVKGRKAAFRLEIPITDSSIPAPLKRIDLEIKIAGRVFIDSFLPEQNISTVFTWDGYDAYGRELKGKQKVEVNIGYVYDGVYNIPEELANSFGSSSGLRITGNPTRQEIIIWQKQKKFLGLYSDTDFGLSGFQLDIIHRYSTLSNELQMGNGEKRNAKSLTSALKTVAGTGAFGNSGDGGYATDANFMYPSSIAFGNNGDIYIADSYNSKIRKISNGIISTVVGTGWGYSGDGGPATEAQLSYVSDITFDNSGNLYIADAMNSCIRKVNKQGMITTFAGTGEAGYEGDGGLATQAKFRYPLCVAWGPDNCLYVGDAESHCIRKVSPDGIIITVAGTGEQGCDGDNMVATKARIAWPEDIKFDVNGNLLITNRYNARIQKISTDGTISIIAGNGWSNYDGDGGLATDASFYPNSIAVDQNGKIFIAGNYRIREISSTGIIETIAGNGTAGYSTDGEPSTSCSMYPNGLEVGPDRNLYFVDYWNNRIRKILTHFPGFTSEDILIPSEDASQIFHFNPNGKHLRTLDALTGKAIFTFNYDESGYLSSIVDIDSNITTIERDAQGNPTAIVAPFGQKTTLSVNNDGYLSTITNPAGETVSCTYLEGGLMSSFTDAKGNTSRFTYDDLGRLVKDEDAAGGFTALERTETALGHEIKKIVKAEDNKVYETVYVTEKLPAGGMRQVTYNCCGGGTVEVITGTDGSTRVTSPDGTITETLEGPDPRFGMQAPIVKRKTITTPSGLVHTMTSSRGAVLEDKDDPFSIQRLIDSVIIDGKLYITTYDAQSKTITSTTPAGRQSVTYMDEKGKVTRSEIPGQLPVDYSYDTKGRLTSITQGAGAQARQSVISYDQNGYMESMTDALGRSVNFTYDPAGRIVQETRPDGRQVSCSYDKNGNLSTLTPPGKPDHGFDYTNVNTFDTYTPPNVGAGSNFTRYSYNLHKQITTLSRPDGQMLDFDYDNIGRLTQINLPNGQVSYIFSDTSNALRSIVSSNGALSYSYDGGLTTDVEWSGLINGSVGVTFNSGMQIVSQSINGGDEVSFGYDDDGLLVSSGEMVLNRDVQNGRLNGTTLESIEDSYSYNEFGNQITYSASVGGSLLYEASHTGIDKLGRITSRTETVDGQTISYSYHYDAAGQLTEVYRNGTFYSRYGYDDNGNRTDYFGPSGTITAGFDDQDRMLSYGGATYQYSANGELQSKTDNNGTTQYEYDVLGNLKTVTLPNGTFIEYLVDGRNRRIGEMVNGTLMKGFLYQDQINPVAELDGSGNVVSRFVYGTKMNVPDYMVKGGVTYRIISDHLGSVRLVVDAQTGAIAQRMDYDEFGNVLLDNNPGFQPFGFAGGMYDHRTGLVRFGARDYDAVTGRWTCKDPIRFEGGDGNLYRYCGGDPVNFVDPEGKDNEIAYVIFRNGSGMVVVQKIPEYIPSETIKIELRETDVILGYARPRPNTCTTYTKSPTQFEKILNNAKKLLVPPPPEPVRTGHTGIRG